MTFSLGRALGAGETARNFADLSLEELMNETVVSVSKREQKVFDTAAAVTVVSNDDLHRSGATNIADALRYVPGLNVASVSSGEWAVSSRGFNNVYANKLLVLVDGRAVYSPLFAGVHWDSMPPILEDVDRVEVIRGPGATVWGANAVNGVINVVTRDARDTQGGLIYGSGGDVEEGGGGARYGGRLGEHTYYRVYGGASSKGDYLLSDGSSADDGWRSNHGGFRLDQHPDEDTLLTWQTNTIGVDSDNGVIDTRDVNTLARLTKKWSDRSGIELQTYYDRHARDEIPRGNTQVDTFDLSAQHSFGLGERHDVTWGLGYRYSAVRCEQTNFAALVRDDEVASDLFSFFAQDEFHMVPDRFTVSGGVKIERNDYTGTEVQPGARLVFKPAAGHTIWAAVSRAVRTPAVIEGEDVFAIIAGPPFVGPGGSLYVPRIVGSRSLSAEDLLASEIGYRVQPHTRVNIDLALFHNDYETLLGLGAPARFVPGAPVGAMELPFVNTHGGETYGGEVAVTVSPSSSWRLSGSYSLLLVDLPGTVSTNPYKRSAPRHQAMLRSSHDLTPRIGLDLQARYVDEIQTLPSYITADIRLSYRIDDHLEFALVGQNLLQDQHPEQTPFYLTAVSEVPRGFYGKLTWEF